jgi:hypothetical protein
VQWLGGAPDHWDVTGNSSLVGLFERPIIREIMPAAGAIAIKFSFAETFSAFKTPGDSKSRQD